MNRVRLGRNFINPMEWLKAIYETVGPRYPIASLIGAAILGALLFGGGWYLLGKQHDKEAKNKIPEFTSSESLKASIPKQALPRMDDPKSKVEITVHGTVQTYGANSPGVAGEVHYHQPPERDIPNEFDSAIVPALAERPTKIQISSVGDSTEAARLAARLAGLFSKAGWSVDGPGTALGLQVDGILLQVATTENPPAARVQSVLDFLKLKHAAQLQPILPADKIVLFVGANSK